jgi:serine/threonine protein kinase
MDRCGALSVNYRYVAPECFDNNPTLESDVFSVGMILYELLSGQPGFPLDWQEERILKKVVLAGNTTGGNDRRLWIFWSGWVT